MIKAIIQYIVFVFSLVIGVYGLSQSGLFTLGEALAKGTALFVIVNIFLIFRFLFNSIKNAISRREMRNSKYHEIDSD